jgi:hypothetical protein
MSIQKYVARAGKRLFDYITGDDAEAASRLLGCCKIDLDTLEKWIRDYNDSAHPNMMAALLAYKEKNFSMETVEAHNKDQEEKELGIKDGIKNAFGNISGWFKDSFSKAWEAVKNVFSKGGEIFLGIKDGILEGLKKVINGLITGINKVIKVPFDGINWALEKLRSISILGVEPFGWIGTISVPQIPQLERGGVLEKGQVGLLEGNGAEAVVPLEKNTKWLDKLADMLKTKLTNDDGTGAGGEQTIVLQVDGKTLARTSLKSINQLTRQTGKLDLLMI